MLLNLESIPHYYKNYIKQVEETDLIMALRISGNRMSEIAHSIPESKADYRYAEGKWSVRELLCHMIDTERIFAYRALRFARNDKTPLEGFEENDYAPQANAEGRSLKKIADEWHACAPPPSICLRDLHLKCFPEKGLPIKTSYR
jgi:hypothetical protein